METKQNAAFNWPVWMPSVDDGRVGATDLTLAISVSKAGGAFSDVTAGCTVTERGNGWYDVAHASGHADTLGVLARRITATGATERNERCSIVSKYASDALQADSAILPTTLIAAQTDVAAVAAFVDTEIQAIIDALGNGTYGLAALKTLIDARATLAQIIAQGGVGGLITGVIDAGVTVSSTFKPISMEKGEKKVLAYQIKSNDVAIDVSAYTFTFGVKRDLYDTVYAFASVAGIVSADSDGVMSVVTFTIPKDATKALAVIESGRYAVGMYDAQGNKTALTPAGGVEFRLMEDILDVA